MNYISFNAYLLNLHTVVRDQLPPEHLLQKRVEIRKLWPVLHRRQPIPSDYSVHLLLQSSLHVREKRQCDEEPEARCDEL